MARHFSIKECFRPMPNALLGRYFMHRGILGDLNFAELPDAKPDRLLAAWLEIPDRVRHQMDAEFREIFDLSCEKGFKANIDEAQWQLRETPTERSELVDNLSALSNHYERVMVTFLSHAALWKGATRFYHADSLRYWRKRKNFQRKFAAVDEISLRELAGRIACYFHRTEGRGKNCVVEPFRRGDLDYCFSYPKIIPNKRWSGSKSRG